MGEYWFLVYIAVFLAALFQAATGMGFGLFAGPVLLIAIGDTAAIQSSLLLSLMIALILSPPLYKHADRTMLRGLLIGTLVGAPIGILVYRAADLGTLELLAGTVVLIMGCRTLAVAQSAAAPKPRAPSLDIVVGGLSGIMTASLAMPGPAPVAWMTSQGCEKTVIRSTLLTFFVPVYLIAIVLQVSIATVTLDTGATTLELVPATLIGLFCGKVLASRIKDKVFRLCISILLLSTAAVLLVSGCGRFMH